MASSKELRTDPRDAESPPPLLRGRTWALYALLWGLVGVLAGSQTFVTYQVTTGDALAWPAYSISLAYWGSWGLAGAVAVRAADRLPLGRDNWYRRVPAHLAVNAVLAFVVLLMYRGLRQWLGFPSSATLPVAYVNTLDTSLITYGSIVLGVHLLAYQRAVRLRDRRAAELAARLSQARLAALRSQLHPHFLFNTLNGIQAFIRDSPETAEEMVAGLADLLRTVLEESPGQEVALAGELEFVRRYLDLQRLRFGDRLDARVLVDPDASAALVPAFVLQPLVENAIEHGIGGRRPGGRIRIEASVDDGALRLVVRDDGVGLQRAPKREGGSGIALQNIRERLERLHGDAARLVLRDADGGGVEARIVMPYVSADERAVPAPEAKT